MHSQNLKEVAFKKISISFNIPCSTGLHTKSRALRCMGASHDDFILPEFMSLFESQTSYDFSVFSLVNTCFSPSHSSVSLYLHLCRYLHSYLHVHIHIHFLFDSYNSYHFIYSDIPLDLSHQIFTIFLDNFHHQQTSSGLRITVYKVQYTE